MATDRILNPNQLVQIKLANSESALAAQSRPPQMELTAVKEKLASVSGPKYWRSLEELSNEPGFDEMMQREFPRQAAEWTDPVSRRGFLKLMSASLALAGLSACTKQPEEAIVPYVQQPEELVPGKPMYFATARSTNLGAHPLLVKSNEYRPTKVEGNPDHPFSLGTSDVFSQASVLDLYDPDRAQSVMYREQFKTWGDFVNEIRVAFMAEKAKQGAGIRFLTESVISPTLASQIKGVLQAVPQAKWYQYDPINRDNARAGARISFGQYVDTQYKLENANVIVSLDADFLSGGNFPGFLKLARDFSKKRKLEDEKAEMNRLYVVESQTSTTGGKADNRLPLRAWEVEHFAFELAKAVGAGGPGGSIDGDKEKKFLEVVAKDLLSSKGRAVVIPGEQQSPSVHALAAAMNAALGAVGKTVVYTDPIQPVPTEQVAKMKELVEDMYSGKVNMLVIIGGNPVFNAPADLKFEEALQKVPLRAHISTHYDETSRLCHWNVPMAHYLESWSDARSYDGTVSIQQPLIDPLYGGKSAHDVLAVFTDSPGTSAYDAVKAYWQAQTKAFPAQFEPWWRKALHDGFIADTALPAKSVTAKMPNIQPVAGDDTIEIVFRPDLTIYDGRFINNGWLQELPKPISRLTWDNASIMSFKTAQAKGLQSQEVIEIEVGGRKVEAPVLIVPGHPDKTITVHVGYGRAITGRVGTGAGFNAYLLRTSTAMDSALGTNIKAIAGGKVSLAVTQFHNLIDNKQTKDVGHILDSGKDLEKNLGASQSGKEAAERGVIRSATLAEFRKNPDFAFEGLREAPDLEPKDSERSLTLFTENGYSSWTKDPSKAAAHQWGMAIDMNSCVGCNACIAACNAENNIAVVGKEQVLLGRAMHWLRIDTYFESAGGDVSNPRAYFQPLPCMHCENAPCEPVCPVGATVHSPEGLNNMVYNRCVGTRYCSNNCPYKVRRFNFLLYQDYETQSLMGVRNPDVSVRSRGVMEKCTYCVQRINSARIAAEKEDRNIRDGEIVTACAQACPAGAIVFGDIADPESRVSRMKKQPRNYALIPEINARPRTTYIASVRNPHQELEEHTENTVHAG